MDEVDSILIDEARTPLIISGQGEKSTQLYTVVDQFVSRLKCQRKMCIRDRSSCAAVPLFRNRLYGLGKLTSPPPSLS